MNNDSIGMGTCCVPPLLLALTGEPAQAAGEDRRAVSGSELSSGGDRQEVGRSRARTVAAGCNGMSLSGPLWDRFVLLGPLWLWVAAVVDDRSPNPYRRGKPLPPSREYRGQTNERRRQRAPAIQRAGALGCSLPEVPHGRGINTRFQRLLSF
jgi:hypothetical protein